MLKFFKLLLCIYFVSISFVHSQPASDTITNIPGEPSFYELDTERQLVYLSIPEANQVLFISLGTLEIVNVLTFSGEPHGLDLSIDNNRLYVGLSETGTVAFVDLEDPDYSYTEINVASYFSSTDVFDVHEVAGQRLFISNNTSFGDPIIYMDLNDLTNVTKVLEDEHFGNAVFASSHDGQFLYLFGRTSLGDLFKLDLTQESLPIIKEAEHGEIFGIAGLTTEISFSADSKRIFLANGQVISDETFYQIAGRGLGGAQRIASLIPSLNKPYVYGVHTINNTVVSYFDNSSFDKVGELQANICNSQNWGDLFFVIPEPDDKGWYILNQTGSNDNQICYVEGVDSDLDGHHDLADNCPDISNSEQENTDDDYMGNVCDDDDDNDGLTDDIDPYPLLFDGDGDGINDLQDAFPQLIAASVDTDEDGRPDFFNEDCDLDCRQNSGLVEDLDDDEDGIPDINDSRPLIPYQGNNPVGADEIILSELPGKAAFIKIDHAESLAFLSIPEKNQVVVVSLASLDVVYTMSFSGAPQGLDLSEDGSVLYVGLAGTGKLAVIDLTQQKFEFEEVDISAEISSRIDRLEVFDVLSLTDYVLITGNSQSPATYFIVSVEKNNLSNVNRVANNQGFSRAPLLAVDDGENYVYVYTERNSFLYRLDASLADFPRHNIHTGNAGSNTFRGTGGFYVLDENSLLLGNGEIVSTDTLRPTHDLGWARASVPTSSKIATLSNDEPSYALNIFDNQGLYKIGSIDNPCGFGQGQQEIRSVFDESGWLIVTEGLDQNPDQLCYIPITEESTEPYPEPDASLNPADYFSLEAGAQWIFNNNFGATFGFSNTVLAGSVNINGAQTTRIRVSNGETEFYTADESGIKLHRSSDSELTVTYSPPIPMTPSRLVVGTIIEQEGTAISTAPGEPSLNLRLVVETEVENYEVVTLSNGKKVEAFRFRQTQSYYNPARIAEITQYYWYAKDIGLIKGHVAAARENEIYEIVSENDYDLDGVPNNRDNDDDNDGILDSRDAFPFDPTESTDTDGDGIGNNSDEDDDNDGLLDTVDNCPLNENPLQFDANNDGEGDACDFDDTDGDGVSDKDDAFPLDPSEYADNDNDGVGDNRDIDDDNDTILDEMDNCPLIANLDQLDENENGVGDACDVEDDCEFYFIGKITVCM